MNLQTMSDVELNALSKKTSLVLQEATAQYNLIRAEVHKRKAKDKAASMASKLTPAEKEAMLSALTEKKEGENVPAKKSK